MQLNTKKQSPKEGQRKKIEDQIPKKKRGIEYYLKFLRSELLKLWEVVRNSGEVVRARARLSELGRGCQSSGEVVRARRRSIELRGGRRALRGCRGGRGRPGRLVSPQSRKVAKLVGTQGRSSMLGGSKGKYRRRLKGGNDDCSSQSGLVAVGESSAPRLERVLALIFAPIFFYITRSQLWVGFGFERIGLNSNPIQKLHIGRFIADTYRADISADIPKNGRYMLLPILPSDFTKTYRVRS